VKNVFGSESVKYINMNFLSLIRIYKRKLLLYKNEILTFILMLMNFINEYNTSQVGSNYKLCLDDKSMENNNCQL
jgi:hypothetical protein